MGLCLAIYDSHVVTGISSASTASFSLRRFNTNDANIAGTIAETRLGNKSDDIKLDDVTFPFIHSIIVVTSPIGDHAPPLLAAITTTPANSHLSFCSLIILAKIV